MKESAFSFSKSLVINPKDGSIIKKLDDERSRYLLESSEKLGIYLTGEDNIVGYSLSTHEKKYEIETGFITSRMTWAFVEEADMILLTDGGIVAYKATTGAKLWKIDGLGVPHQTIIDKKNGKMIGITQSYTVVIDLKQGKLLKKIETEFSRSIMMGTKKDSIKIDSDGRYLYVMSPECISCIDLVEGKQIWNNSDVGAGGTDNKFLTGEVIQLDNRKILAYGQNDNLALFIDKFTGKVLKEIKTDEDMRIACINEGRVYLIDGMNIYTVIQESMEIENTYKFSKVNDTSDSFYAIMVNSISDSAKKNFVILTEDECIYFDLTKMAVKTRISLGRDYNMYQLPIMLSEKYDKNNFFINAIALDSGPQLLTFLYSLDLENGRINYYNLVDVKSANSKLNMFVIYPEHNNYLIGGGLAYKIK